MSKVRLFILAGGFGSRLKSVVSDVPKPMAPVSSQPFIKYLIENWLQQGVNSFTFLLFHKSDQIKDFILSDLQYLLEGCDVSFIIEPRPMGTGGAVAFAVKETSFNGSFLVVNADTWLGNGIKELNSSPSPCLSSVCVPNINRYGSLCFEGNKVKSFLEKKEVSGKGWINAGLYALHSDLFKEWDGLPFSLEEDMFPKLSLLGKLSYLKLDTQFIDIGIPEDYYRFCDWIESNKEVNL